MIRLAQRTTPARRTDPTRTVMLRRRYERALSTRFQRLIRDLWQTVRDHDALALDASRFHRFQPAPPGAFDFATDARKVQGFMAWVRAQADRGILEILQADTGAGEPLRVPWQNTYVRAVYLKAISDAQRAVTRAGGGVADATIEAIFQAPIHAGRVALLYTRNFEALQGITAAMSSAMSHTLAQALVEGVGAQEAARRLVQQVDGIGIRRGRVLARTEMIRAHAEGALAEYERLGVQGVTADVEFLTAHDTRVCGRCARLAGTRYPLAAARGLLPVHPQCRCAWRPVLRRREAA